MNSELLLSTYEAELNKEMAEIQDSRVRAEILLHGNRLEIKFEPEIPQTLTDAVVRASAKKAIELHRDGTDLVGPIVGHISMLGATQEDVNAITLLPGINFRVAA